MPTFKVYKNGAEVEKFEGASEPSIRALLAKHKWADFVYKIQKKT